MVGVPRSKACVNCKARRKGCDAKRPCCSQCLGRGVACQGYPNELNFRFEDPAAKAALSISGRKRDSSSKALVTAKAPYIAALQILPSSFQETAFRSQIYDRYFGTYLPHSSGRWLALQTDLEILPATTWLHTAASAAPPESHLSDALSALTLGRLARDEGRHDFQHQSRISYVQAIHGLNKTLGRGHQTLDDTTLAAVMALSIYEVSNLDKPYFIGWADFRAQMQEGSTTRAQGWVSHVRGAQTLVHLRGTHNFSNTFGQKLFLGSRLTELISAIGSRKASPAGVLWSESHPCSEISTHIQLFEILQSLPEIMQLSDEISPTFQEAMSEERHNLYTKLFYTVEIKCQELVAKLSTWYATLEAQNQHHHQGRLFYPELSTLYAQLPASSPVRHLPFKHFLCFPNADIAQQVVLYWTGLLLMESTFWLAKGRLQRAGYDASFPSSPSFSPMGVPISSPTCGQTMDQSSRPLPSQALFIAQSLEYFVHPDMGFLGINFIGFPMAVVQGAYAHFNVAELAWLDVIFERMRQMSCGLGEFLDEMAHKAEDTQLRLLKV